MEYLLIVILGLMPFFCVYTYRLGISDGQKVSFGIPVIDKKTEPIDSALQEDLKAINEYGSDFQ